MSLAGINLGEIDAGWLWLVIAALLAILELAVPGIFLVWLSAAALVTGLATFAFGLDLTFQLVLFGIFAVASVLAGGQIYRRTARLSSDPFLNERAARLYGQTVTVVNAIADGEGRVKVGDSVWAARGPDAPVGARVLIVGVEGSCLRVTTTEALAGPEI